MKLGALDYLQKPFEIDELLVVVRRALEHQRLRTEYRYLVSERDEQFDHYGIVGRSRAIEEVIKRAELVAETKSTVLITGETGTGKELVARAIHDRSAQRDMPLIKVNCAAIPETLLESELFGHVRGAFTGATATKKGKFALADGGTIFLDEIGTMSPTLQSKLLRVLQEREVEPLGSERTEKIDVRVIAATNRDLRQMVADGKFQEDLFYRLNVIPVLVPALRERREDIPLLAQHFRKKSCDANALPEDDRAGCDAAAHELRLARQRASSKTSSSSYDERERRRNPRRPARSVRGERRRAGPVSIPDEGIHFTSVAHSSSVILRCLEKRREQAAGSAPTESDHLHRQAAALEPRAGRGIGRGRPGPGARPYAIPQRHAKQRAPRSRASTVSVLPCASASPWPPEGSPTESGLGVLVTNGAARRGRVLWHAGPLSSTTTRPRRSPAPRAPRSVRPDGWSTPARRCRQVHEGLQQLRAVAHHNQRCVIWLDGNGQTGSRR
jgi:hypothetical protein